MNQALYQEKLGSHTSMEGGKTGHLLLRITG